MAKRKHSTSPILVLAAPLVLAVAPAEAGGPAPSSCTWETAIADPAGGIDVCYVPRDDMGNGLVRVELHFRNNYARAVSIEFEVPTDPPAAALAGRTTLSPGDTNADPGRFLIARSHGTIRIRVGSDPSTSSSFSASQSEVERDCPALPAAVTVMADNFQPCLNGKCWYSIRNPNPFGVTATFVCAHENAQGPQEQSMSSRQTRSVSLPQCDVYVVSTAYPTDVWARCKGR